MRDNKMGTMFYGPGPKKVEEMKPCPFSCGSEVKVVANLVPYKGYDVYFPQCSDSGCPGHNTHAYYRTEEEAIRVWNKRIEVTKSKIYKGKIERRILDLLKETPSIPAHDIADELHLKESLVSKILDRLEKKKLIDGNNKVRD